MSHKWFLVTLQNYQKEGVKLLLSAFLIVLLFFITAYGNHMEAIDFFPFVFALKYKNPTLIGLYTGLVSILMIIPIRYIEWIHVNSYKELALRIRHKKKWHAMMAKGVFYLVLAEYFLVFFVMYMMSFFLPKSGNIVLQLVPAFILYVLLTYVLAMGYYRLSAFAYGPPLMFCVMLAVHLNNIFPLIKSISIPTLLLHRSAAHISLLTTVLFAVIFISAKLTQNLKKGDCVK